MKSASKFEKIAARCWNLFNEGKPFTPIFTVGTMLLFHLGDLDNTQRTMDFLLAFLTVIPLFIM